MSEPAMEKRYQLTFQCFMQYQRMPSYFHSVRHRVWLGPKSRPNRVDAPSHDQIPVVLVRRKKRKKRHNNHLWVDMQDHNPYAGCFPKASD